MTSQVGKFMGYVGIGIIGVTLLPYAISPTRTLSHFRREKGYKMTANVRAAPSLSPLGGAPSRAALSAPIAAAQRGNGPETGVGRARPDSQPPAPSRGPFGAVACRTWTCTRPTPSGTPA